MEVEEIPDEDQLFYRVPQVQLRQDRLHEGVFRDRGDGMSVDWEKYSTPQETRQRGRLEAHRYGIVTFVAGQVRSIRVPPLTVVHSPIEGTQDQEENQAHSDILGINASKTMARLKLFALVDGWEIPPGVADPAG